MGRGLVLPIVGMTKIPLACIASVFVIPRPPLAIYLSKILPSDTATITIVIIITIMIIIIIIIVVIAN